MKVTLDYQGGFPEVWQGFRETQGTHFSIAVLGGAVADLQGVSPELAARHRAVLDERVQGSIREMLGLFRDHGIAVVTAGTNSGVPAAASSMAAELGLTLVHFHPVIAHRYLNADAQPDLEVCVLPRTSENSSWGDDSADLLSLVDAVVFIGGGYGTLIELAHVLKLNEAKIRRGERPIFMVSLHDFGGFGDRLYDFATPNVREECMPHERIFLGRDAAKFILRSLHADEIYS